MTTVREDLGKGPEGTGDGQRGQPAAGTPRPQAPRRWRPSLTSVVGLFRRHWLFSLVLAVAVLPRLVAMLGFRPAMLFRPDTFDRVRRLRSSLPEAIHIQVDGGVGGENIRELRDCGAMRAVVGAW